MKVYLTSIGCKLNQCEIAALTREFARAGYQVVDAPAQADIHVLNSCAVTKQAERKSRHAIHRLRRANPEAFIVAAGCCGEIWTEQPHNAEKVDCIVNNANKDNLVNLVAELCPSEQVKSVPLVNVDMRTRALVKIQDGCDNHCTYCIVCKLRGKSRSCPPDAVLAQVKKRLAEEYREIVLTGVNIGAYGRDLENVNLARLVEMILCETPVPRLRLSSIEPWDFTTEMLVLWEDRRLCRHVHLPLQSGCDATLARMARRGTTADFAELVTRIREEIPDVAITTDIIAGFPGETAAEFAETRRFVEKINFARAHIFSYSARPGTLAAKMPKQVPVKEKRARAAQLREITTRSGTQFRKQFLDRTLEVLWETTVNGEEPSNGQVWSGLTDNYMRVFARDSEDWYNVITPTRLISLTEKGVWGKIK